MIQKTRIKDAGFLINNSNTCQVDVSITLLTAFA